ncbi:MAG: His-Xaa-Ser system radical SAM maturase HxsB [Nanobdellota archaeon]
MKYLINPFRFKKINDKYLVTTSHGNWIALNKEEFEHLQYDNIKEENLFKKLESKGIILTKNNKEEIKNDYNTRYNFLRQGTSLHIVAITLRCNQKCLYCQTSSTQKDAKGYDMDEKTAEQTVDYIFQSPSKQVTIEFQGGEPLLNFEIIKKITNYAKNVNKKYNKNLRFVMVTNLTKMTDEILEYCIKNQIDICTSLDGPKKLHDFNRPYKKSSHELVTGWIKKIQQEYKKKELNAQMNALVTITKESIKYPKEIIDEYLGLGLKGIHLRYFNKLGYANKNKDKIEYSPEEFIKFWKKSLDYIIKKNKEGIFFRERGTTIILQKILQKVDPGFLDMRSPCGAVIGQMAYNHKGDIFCCDEGRMFEEEIFKIGSVKNQKFKEVISCEESTSLISSSINDTDICEYCPYKPYCGLCPVVNYAEQGSIVANVPQTTYCQIFKAQFDYIFEKYLFDESAKEVFEKWIKFYD